MQMVMIRRNVNLIMEEEVWTLLEHFEYSLRQRAVADGKDMRAGYVRIVSAIVREALLNNAEEILRYNETTQRNSVVVRLTDFHKRNDDSELAELVHADGGRAVSYLPEEGAGTIRSDFTKRSDSALPGHAARPREVRFKRR